MNDDTQVSMNRVHWTGGVPRSAVDALLHDGGLAVVPTKVGYILMTSDRAGLERKFDAKERNRNKPGVVLVSSLEMLRGIAQLTPRSTPCTSGAGTRTSCSGASCPGATRVERRCRRTAPTNS